MKKISLALLLFPFLLSSSFAQLSSMPYGLKDGKSVQGQHFPQQAQLSVPYTEAQCLPNNGLYENERIYLPGDVNNDGVKDAGKPYYLSDNLRVNGDAKSRSLYVIDPIETKMYYHLPQSNSFTIWSNNVNYLIGSNSVWYRQSKVAPVNQWVRAISSEPVLFQAPIGGSLLDRVVQVAYQISYRGYRSNGGAATNYFTYPVSGSDDFSSDVKLWSLNGSYDDNKQQGPLWQSDYIQSPGVISTSSITWGDPIAHGLECLNYHLSRCGDGYIDVSGQEPVKGTEKQSYAISDSGVSETCDPGANLATYTDDVMPNGAVPTAYYNCTASCKILSNPSLSIDKQQKLSSSSVYEGVGLGTLSNISYTSPAGFDFKIVIKNDGGDATNVVLNDVLPVGFVLSPSGCAGTLSDGASVACEAQAGTSLTSVPFALSAGKSATFIVKGALNAATATTNAAYASYTNPSTNVVANTATDIVNQTPIIRPVLSYTKTVRNVTSNSNNGQFIEADNQASAVVVKTGDLVEYQITVNKTGGPVTNAILTDPAVTNNGFAFSAYSINNGSKVSVSAFPTAGIDLTSILNANPSVVVTLYGTVKTPTGSQFSNTATLNESSYVLVPTFAPGSNVAWTVLDNTPPPTPDVSIKKEVESVSVPNVRQELSTVSSGQTVRFKLTYKNISAVNAINAVITDSLPVGLSCRSAMHQDGATIPCNANAISYTETVMNPGVEKYIIITAVATSALPTGVTTNIGNIQLPGGPLKSDPAQVQLQSVTAFDITKRITSGSVISGTIISYEIGFRNTGNTPITSYTLTDPLQHSTYLAGSSRLNGNIVVTPAYSSGLLTRGCASTNTALNGQSICPLQAGATGVITFDVLVK